MARGYNVARELVQSFSKACTPGVADLVLLLCLQVAGTIPQGQCQLPTPQYKVERLEQSWAARKWSP